jgi:malonate decarboxylase epsilon subunit
MKVAFLFPGQGSQRPGMLHDLPAHRAIAETLEEASTILGRDVLRIDTKEASVSTVNVQLLLLISGVAVIRALLEEGAEPDLAAGLSVGAFGAAVTVGVLKFREALQFVQLRGQLMENAYPQGYGMAAIVGLDERRLNSMVQETSSDNAPVYVSSLNSPRQIVVSGADSGLELIIERARSAGATKAERLNVRVPSHCELLNSAAEELERAMASAPINRPRIPYIANYRGRALREPEAVRDDLAKNMSRPVRWHDGTEIMFELGARLFVELPPGRVLTRLAAEAFPEARAVACDGMRLDSVAELVRRTTNSR